MSANSQSSSIPLATTPLPREAEKAAEAIQAVTAGQALPAVTAVEGLASSRISRRFMPPSRVDFALHADPPDALTALKAAG